MKQILFRIALSIALAMGVSVLLFEIEPIYKLVLIIIEFSMIGCMIVLKKKMRSNP